MEEHLVDDIAGLLDMIGGEAGRQEGLLSEACPANDVASLPGAVQQHLDTRIEHLLAERDMLKTSHVEAMEAVLKERDSRLREQEAHMNQLRQLHLQNEMILNSAGEGIIGIDLEGAMTFVNPAAARMLGYEIPELIGLPMHATIHFAHPDGRPYPAEECPIATFRECTAVGSAGGQAFWRKDGTSFPIEYTNKAIHDGQAALGSVVTFRDITQRRRLESQLRQAQKLESIGHLAAGIAHEINTPTQYIGDNIRFLEESFGQLAPMLEACRRLAEDASPRGGEEAVGAIRAAAAQAELPYLLSEIPKAVGQSLDGVRHVTKIVRSMKEFSHPNSDEMQTIDLNRAIESTVTVSRNEWKYVADVTTELAADLPPVSCLPGDINQVLLNLTINAAHAIGDKYKDRPGEKGRITIGTRRDGDWVEIRVADDGMGIPQTIRSRVYDPFFTTKAVGRGTGQGLAIAHSIVSEKHHGSIHFETEAGVGTTFYIRLPLHRDDASGKGAGS